MPHPVVHTQFPLGLGLSGSGALVYTWPEFREEREGTDYPRCFWV